jgi:hypothetical protein
VAACAIVASVSAIATPTAHLPIGGGPLNGTARPSQRQCIARMPGAGALLVHRAPAMLFSWAMNSLARVAVPDATRAGSRRPPGADPEIRDVAAEYRLNSGCIADAGRLDIAMTCRSILGIPVTAHPRLLDQEVRRGAIRHQVTPLNLKMWERDCHMKVSSLGSPNEYRPPLKEASRALYLH